MSPEEEVPASPQELSTSSRSIADSSPTRGDISAVSDALKDRRRSSGLSQIVPPGYAS